MKKLFLFILSVVVFSSVFSQTGNDTTLYTFYKNLYGNRSDRLWANKVLDAPRDTVFSKYGLARIGGVLYVGNGTLWSRATGSDPLAIIGFRSIDSVTFVGFREDGTADTVHFTISGLSGGSGGSDVDSPGVASFNGRLNVVVPLSADYSAFYPLLSGSYADPSWIANLAASKIAGAGSVTAGSSKITLGGIPSGAGLQNFSIDVNQANFALSLLGGLLNVSQINASGSYNDSNVLYENGTWGRTPTVGGGGGNTNTNIGTGYRLAIPGGNNIKTLFGRGYVVIDSSSNANGLTIYPDTSVGKLSTDTKLATGLATKVTSVSGTTNRITSSGGATPAIDISATFEALLSKKSNTVDVNNASSTSANLASMLSDEIGSGKALFVAAAAHNGMKLGWVGGVPAWQDTTASSTCSGCYVASDTTLTLVTHTALNDSLNKTTWVVNGNHVGAVNPDSIYWGGSLIAPTTIDASSFPVRFNFGSDAPYDLFIRDSTTGYWKPIHKGTVNQSLQMLPAGGVGWANQAGGSGITGLTAGRISFAAGSTSIMDDGNLFWDNTNKRLGIGTATPTADLLIKKGVTGGVSSAIWNTTACTTCTTNFQAVNDLSKTMNMGLYSSTTTAFGTQASGIGYIETNSPAGMAIVVDANAPFTIATGTGAPALERFKVSGTGAIKFDTYGSGSNTGTATYGLSVDASGNVIETTASASGYATSVAVNTANYTVPTGSLIYITLPDLTGQANRNVVLPAAFSGVHTVIKNNNTSASGFTWSFTVRTVKDFGNNTITTVPNLAVVQLFDDGTNENIGN